MKILNPIKLLLVLTMLAVGFSSCEEDDETIYDYLIGRTWVGSLGFAVSILSNSVMAGYLASAAYFLLNFVGNTTTR